MTPITWFLGVDWGQETHVVCLVNADGIVVGTRTVAHTVDAMTAAVQWVQEQSGAAPEAVGVAIETPRGVVVHALLERGFSVFALNPKQLDRFRDRFTAAGAKDDRRDAWALADGLRTDRRAFRVVRPEPAHLVLLREWVRVFEDLQADEQRLVNRLREQLTRVDAPWLSLSPAASDPWVWTILARASDPDAWPTLPRRTITAALREHRIRRHTPEAVVAALRQPRLPAAPGVGAAVAARMATLVPQLRLVHQQRLDAERQIDGILAQLATETLPDEPREHRDVEILLSLPGVGRMVTATMLTEAAGPLATRDYDRLRTYTGAAPVTKRSGKRTPHVQMRYACHPRLRQALYHWAKNSIQHDDAARCYYRQLRERGHGHARALRSVADRWLRILITMLRTDTLYDPTRPQKILATAA